MTFHVDSERTSLKETGIYIRATLNGKWESHDLAHLDRESVLLWLRDRQQDMASPRSRAEQTVLILLGHRP